jgi:hypothetical protein
VTPSVLSEAMISFRSTPSPSVISHQIRATLLDRSRHPGYLNGTGMVSPCQGKA